MNIDELSNIQIKRIANFTDSLAKGIITYGFFTPYFNADVGWKIKILYTFISIIGALFLLKFTLELDAQYE